MPRTQAVTPGHEPNQLNYYDKCKDVLLFPDEGQQTFSGTEMSYLLTRQSLHSLQLIFFSGGHDPYPRRNLINGTF
jgi:hypothetical protein